MRISIFSIFYCTYTLQSPGGIFNLCCLISHWFSLYLGLVHIFLYQGFSYISWSHFFLFYLVGKCLVYRSAFNLKPLFIKGRGLEFSKFSKKGRGSDYSHKEGGIGKIGRGRGITDFHTNLSFPLLSFSECFLVASNQQMTFTSE